MNGFYIDPDELTDTVHKVLTEYVRDTGEIVKMAVTRAARNAIRELRKTSPKKTGKYRKGWEALRRYETSTSVEYLIRNRVYKLTHLLEDGHAKRGGGRVQGIPHIAPAEKHAEESIEKELKEKLSNG